MQHMPYRGVWTYSFFKQHLAFIKTEQVLWIEALNIFIIMITPQKQYGKRRLIPSPCKEMAMSENLDSSLAFDSRLENPSNILIGLDLSADNAEAKVATFDFDYYTHFSDLGLDLEARFTNVSQTATWLLEKTRFVCQPTAS